MTVRLASAFLLAILCGFAARGSDHIDGPVTTSHRVGDLTDLYAFPTPHRPGFLTVILNAYPIVPGSGHFSDKVNYGVFFRRVAIQASPLFATSDEVAIHCAFVTPEESHEHEVICSGPNGLRAHSRYEVVPGRNARGLRLYAGMRADPFFFNAGFATDALEGTLNPPDDSNVMAGVNILTIVMEVELRALYAFDPPAMIAVAAESTTRDSPRALLRRLDRVGRPEVTNVSLAARTGADLRDRYNLERPFEAAPARQRPFQEKFAQNIAFYDGLDGKTHWKERERNELAAILAADFLVVDLRKPCPAQSFFEIEKALLGRKQWTTCGGRRPADDIMDTLFTLYVSGMNGKAVRDGVDRPATPVSTTFPYLAPPDLGSWSLLRGYLARKVLGIPDVP